MLRFNLHPQRLPRGAKREAFWRRTPVSTVIKPPTLITHKSVTMLEEVIGPVDSVLPANPNTPTEFPMWRRVYTMTRGGVALIYTHHELPEVKQ